MYLNIRDSYNGQYSSKLPNGYGKRIIGLGNRFEGIWLNGLMVEGIYTDRYSVSKKQVFNTAKDDLDLKIWSQQKPTTETKI